ncbi:thioredoxin [Flavobacterium agricola]|uniref:Thioredoxin n=1 Tax=Flavobacterium agricola TaxID=2870839 RepID=A0ABY6LZD5_9FLAO|nr:thioredoxin [Flavobacterium agricola]UYW00810.1 thioredoxin [Flavobacterium agricola]
MTLQELIQTTPVVLVDFFAEWCGPCHTLKPILQTVKQHVGDAVKIVKVDVDKYREVAAEYQIRSMPTLLLFKNGELVWRHSGVVGAQDLVRIIEQHK